MTSVTVISAVTARITHLLKLIADEPPKNTPSWRNDAEKLRSDLQPYKTNLEHVNLVDKQQSQFVDFEKKIVQLCYEIDDSLAELEMSLNIPAKSGRNFFTGHTKLFQHGISKTTNNKPDLKTLTKKLSEISQITLNPKPANQTKQSVGSPRPSARSSNQDADENNSPGEDLATMEEKVIAVLRNEEELPVVCIWGESGTGKSTFVKKVFYNEKVREQFKTFAWVSVKQDFQTKKVLREILLQLFPEGGAGDIMAMDEFKLTQKIFKVHDEKPYLIVLQDVRTVEDWWSICVAFPTIEQSKSKILITAWSKEVAKAATSQDGAYEMIPLTEKECFNVLRGMADFSDEECKELGNIIFSLSGGARLPVIVLGKSLKTMEVEARNQLLTDFDKKQGDGRNALELSYEVLSHELKPCLLYMGQFPEGREIEIDKLYCLLSAENLIIPSAAAAAQPASASASASASEAEPASASASASVGKKAALEKLLGILEQRSVVQVQDVSFKRKFKSCKLHDRIRDFCKFQGSKEDFFEIVEFKKARITLKGTTPRLAIYLNQYVDENTTSFCIDHDMAKKLRSLLIFDTYQSGQQSTWPSALNDLKDFVRLRVVDFNRTDFRIRKLPKGIDKLVLLKYLSFGGCWLEDLPSYIGKLVCLETLDLRTKSKITIPDVLHTLTRLQHLYFPSEYESQDGKSKLQLNGLEDLEILVNLDTSVCEVKHLSILRNILILTTLTHGDYTDLNSVIECLKKNKAGLQYSSVTIKNFDCYTKERRTIFNSLLQCESLHHLNVEGQIDKLSKDVSISSSLTEMIFDGSELSPPKPRDDHPMEVLGKHEKLHTLVLSNDAFIGQKISFSDEPNFPNLKILKLLNLSKVEEIIFENDAMPQLSTLVIQNCRALKNVMIPQALKSRLLPAQGNKGDDVFSVQPLPNNQEN